MSSLEIEGKCRVRSNIYGVPSQQRLYTCYYNILSLSLLLLAQLHRIILYLHIQKINYNVYPFLYNHMKRDSEISVSVVHEQYIVF